MAQETPAPTPAPAPAAAAAPSPAPTPTPSAAAPAPVPATTPAAVAPVAGAAPSPAAAPTPAAAEPPAAAPTPAPAAAEAPKPAAETLLGTEQPKPAPTPAVDAPKTPPAADGKTPPVAEPEKKDGQSADPAPPSFEPFKLPDGITVDKDAMGEFTSLLGKFELGAKADHAAVQAFGQTLVEHHIAQMRAYADRATEAWKQAWADKKTEWKRAFLDNQEWGGNRFQTSVDAAREFISLHGGTADEQAELRSLLEESGLGNHLVMIRTLARANQAMRQGAPVPATMPPPAEKKSKVATLYGGTPGNKG